MGRETMVQVGFRVPSEVVARIDHELEVQLGERPNLRLTRADVVRELLVQALDARSIHRETQRSPGKKRKRAP